MRGFLVCAIGALCPLAAVGEPADADLTAVLQAGCVVPTTAVTVPDGSTAAEPEMIAAASAIKRRDAEATAYARCVNDAAARMLSDAALPESRRGAVQATQRELVDAAVVPVEGIAANFNRELRCFRSRGAAAAPCTAQAARPPGSTPPKFAQGSRELGEIMSTCYPIEARRGGNEGRLSMDILVGEDGTASYTRLPDGAAGWQLKAADCVARKLRFEPARLADGTPYPSTVRVPISFTLSWEGEDVSPVQPASLTSKQELIAQIHRACYPAELLASGTYGEVLYKVDLSALGRITKLELLRSSGDARIDEAGRCIMSAYEFEPARRDGRPLVSTFPWTVKVLPPGS